MISDAILSILIQMSIVVLLCIGFSFTYMIEHFPNFSHISYTLIGSIVSFSLVKFYGINIYYTWPVSMTLCGLLGTIIYFFLVEPIRKRKDANISLTITFIALSVVIESLVGVFSYWVVISFHETTRGFLLKSMDFSLNGIPGVAYMAPLTSLVLIAGFYYLFKYTKVGIAIQAVAENSELAEVFGVNTRLIHMVSWFIVGSLSGLSGSIIILWTTVRGSFGEEMLMTVMAGSLIGGFDNIFGAVLGGVIITLFKEGFVVSLMNFRVKGVPLLVDFSQIIHGFSKLIPVLFIILVMMLLPEGLANYIKSKRGQ